LIFNEHITIVYALITKEKKLQYIRGTEKKQKTKEKNMQTLVQKKYKYSYKTKHNTLQS